MKEKCAQFIIGFVLFSLPSGVILSQSSTDSIQNNRLKWTIACLGIGYGASTYLLDKAWYQDFPRSSFHFFDDSKEWEQMDKAGHIFSTHFQSIYAYNLYKWSGLNDKKSIIYGAATSLLFQSTIEVLDGFSEEWGFSVYDFGTNLIGASLFAWQQSEWKEQRILVKMSSSSPDYSSPVLLERRDDLFGSSAPTRFLKDYNAQTYWLSFNLNSLLKKDNTPKWLNVALGYGAENMYGGFDNSWLIENGIDQIVDQDLRRHRQFYLAPDIDLTKIPTKSKFLKALLGALNIFKIPLPSLEINTLGEVDFHYFKF